MLSLYIWFQTLVLTTPSKCLTCYDLILKIQIYCASHKPMKCRPSSDLDPFSLAGENGKVEYFEDFPIRLVHKFEGESNTSLCKCRWYSQELNSWGPHQSLEWKREICRVMLLLHKTSLEGILSRSCVVTAKKCTKECTARVELSLAVAVVVA